MIYNFAFIYLEYYTQFTSNSFVHRELILEGKCDKAPGQNIITIYLAGCIQLKPVRQLKYILQTVLAYIPT